MSCRKGTPGHRYVRLRKALWAGGSNLGRIFTCRGLGVMREKRHHLEKAMKDSHLCKVGQEKDKVKSKVWGGTTSKDKQKHERRQAAEDEQRPRKGC